MNAIRKIVSGSRRRFQDGQFDLDITYITSRVVAMSYPACTLIEQTYRNPVASVVRFLEEKHGKKYWIFNTSERTYDKSPFHGQVSDYNWPDHHAPPMHFLFEMAKEMLQFLRDDIENVVVVHCNSGKGRTGTAIAVFLLFSGLASNITESLRYYGWKRFSSGKGVT